VLVLDMIEILPPMGKYKYGTWRVLPVKCYIDNSVRLRSCIRNVNNPYTQVYVFGCMWAYVAMPYCRQVTSTPVLEAVMLAMLIQRMKAVEWDG
jgi:hypothetical protein